MLPCDVWIKVVRHSRETAVQEDMATAKSQIPIVRCLSQRSSESLIHMAISKLRSSQIMLRFHFLVWNCHCSGDPKMAAS